VRVPALTLVYAGLLAVAAFSPGLWPHESRYAAIATGAILLAGGTAALLVSVPRAWALAAGAALVVAVLGLGWPQSRVQERNRYVHFSAAPERFQGFDRTYAWARDVRGARIAIAGIWAQYPLFGNDLSNDVEYVGVGSRGGTFRTPATCREWRALLRDGDFDYAVISPPQHPYLFGKTVPARPEVAWTRSSRGAKEVLTEPVQVFVFALEEPPDPAACA
jgi:hypothetical protein